ncbi:MAG: ABC transporter ATP-binding protein [Candidatus Tectomicrobia bacterium]|uniref:ABC transporter ATP-binding protein n=1 Tax=Tectimicrobiota bacterium TaxID=2528274 RepID=A0A932MMK7_UNCTE|nr:ABC transporter ATP-binding protein [Candidatus Tectomicrobia bacterium]
MGQEAARLDKVTKTYLRGGAPIRALVEVDLAVRAGEFLAVTGPSGSGKSTLLHLLGAMDEPTAGRVFIGGRALDGLGDAELSRIRREEVGFVYQFFHLLPTMTARENAALPLILQGLSWDEASARAEEMLARVGLAERMEHLPRQLSGGEMQRVALARALVPRPRLLLADEPTGNLDSRIGREMLDLLAGLAREEGAALVMATHAREPLALAARRVSLLDGRLVEEAP